ncbi:MAG TPA: CHRD domain-containing protein [Chthoniobacterales bacterium]|nr:CHRD domain-containing protein [Chthoniobacterales bacterium]
MKTARLFPVLLAVSLVLLTTGRAQVYTTTMTGPQESPINNSPGTGTAQITLDLALHTLRVVFDFTGLQGTASIAHIHGATDQPFTGTASPATNSAGFPGLPAAMSGSYDMTFSTLDAATWNSTYVNGAGGGTLSGTELAFKQDLDDGQMYLNIHSSAFPGGEIRGFLAVPEPATIGLIAIGGCGLLLAMRRARRS